MAKSNNLVTKDHLDKKLNTFKDDLFTTKDEIVGEIKAMIVLMTTDKDFRNLRANQLP